MRAIAPIDGRPEKRIYTSIIADYDIPRALCELIDNVIDNGKNNSLDKVKIVLNLNVENQTIEIKDSSGGVTELRNLIAPGATGNVPKKEIIGIFGVGTKRATVALAKNICIRTRINGDHTKILKYDEDWIKSDDWYITPYVAERDEEEISIGETIIELNNLRKDFDENSVQNIKKHLSETYAFFIEEKFLDILLNGESISSKFFDNWSYSPKYPPKEFLGFYDADINKKLRISITAGLTTKSNPSNDWGVYIYCNKRLVGRELKGLEVGFGQGLAGKPHASISLLNVIVSIEGSSDLMPWNSSKSEINYSHPVFKKIQKELQEIVVRYSRISRSLQGRWAEELFKHDKGDIIKETIAFNGGHIKNLPPLPPPRSSDIKKIKDKNEAILVRKPWLLGVFGGIEAEDLIKNKVFAERNRYLLIILDSTLEIAFKEFLVNEVSRHYTDQDLTNIFYSKKNLFDEIKKYTRGKRITVDEWRQIKFYSDLRNKLIHQRAAVSLNDEHISQFSVLVKIILGKLFDLELKNE